ncbi:MAG: cupin domain-containing protein [Chitinophagaceae bacterium]
MTNTANEATPLRPGGSRLLNAPFLEMDLNKCIAEIRSESTWQIRDRNSITIFKSDDITIVLMGMHEHADLKTHTANGTIMVQVLDGKIDFKTEARTTVLENGQIIALQPNIPHSVLAVKESFFLLTVFASKIDM